MLFGLCRSSEDLRSPAAKLAKAAYKRRGIKRPHDDDRERREFFAGLVACDKDHKYTAVQLMKLARLNTSTAQSWKRQCLNNMELFTAGPRYSHAGNPKLTDEDVTLVRRCSVWLISSLLQVKTVRDFVLDNPYEGERRHSAMLKAQEGIDVSALVDSRSAQQRTRGGENQSALLFFRLSIASFACLRSLSLRFVFRAAVQGADQTGHDTTAPRQAGSVLHCTSARGLADLDIFR